MLKQIEILCLRCRKLRTFPGKFLNFGKTAGVKDLTNIMSGREIFISSQDIIHISIKV